MSRAAAIKRIETYFDDGRIFADLARRVEIRSESQEPASRGEPMRYIAEEMRPVSKPWDSPAASTPTRWRAGQSGSRENMPARLVYGEMARESHPIGAGKGQGGAAP